MRKEEQKPEVYCWNNLCTYWEDKRCTAPILLIDVDASENFKCVPFQNESQYTAHWLCSIRFPHEKEKHC